MIPLIFHKVTINQKILFSIHASNIEAQNDFLGKINGKNEFTLLVKEKYGFQY